MDIRSIFNKFAGREVEMKTELREVCGYKFYEHDLKNSPDPVITEMETEAKKHGLSLRVMWEGMGGTCDYDTSRVNATLKRGEDGKWRVSPFFGLG